MVEDNDFKLVGFKLVEFLANMYKGVSLVVSSDDGVLNDIRGHNEIIQRHVLRVKSV